MQNSLKSSNELFIIDDKEIAYQLVRSKKRKRSMAMKLHNNGELQINVPFKTDINFIEKFIINKYSWIIKQQNKQQKHPKKIIYQYTDGEKYWYLGIQYPLKLIIAKQSKVELLNNNIVVFYRKNTSVKNLVNKWYRHQALEYFSKRTKLLVNSYNFPKIKQIKVRNMRARWGSCSSQAIVTYNINLLKASSTNIDYVIIHELCHLVHPNHSSRFYQLQTMVNPSWQQQKQQLNQFGYKYIS